MSELINNSKSRKELLKHVILQLHKGEAPEQVKKQLMDLMQKNGMFFRIDDCTHGNQKKTERIVWALQGRYALLSVSGFLCRA